MLLLITLFGQFVLCGVRYSKRDLKYINRYIILDLEMSWHSYSYFEIKVENSNIMAR